MRKNLPLIVMTLLTALCLCAARAEGTQPLPGSVVTFGRYPQTRSGKDSTPIEWLVLDYDAANSRALLISLYGLDCLEYNEERAEITWEACTLRAWLNGDFYARAFSAAEKEAILTAAVDNGGSQGFGGYGTDGGNDTQDRIFLLSYAEAWKYFTDDYARMCEPTDYAVSQGSWPVRYYSAGGKASCSWWLRSPGGDQNSAAVVRPSGARGDIAADRPNNAVRPALWLDAGAGVF